MELVKVQLRRVDYPRQSEEGPVSAEALRGAWGWKPGRRHICGD